MWFQCIKKDNLIKVVFSGEEGIRTPDTLLAYTRFPGEPVQPLLHLSNVAIIECDHKSKIKLQILKS